MERKLLFHKVAKLEAEVKERDRLDAQIETCVCNMFERMRLLEENNRALTSQLHMLGAEATPLPPMPALDDTRVEQDVQSTPET